MQYLETGAQDQIRSIFDVVRDYTYTLNTLDGYDYQSLEIRNTSGGETFHATYENAMDVINSLKSKFGESSLFGNEKDESFKSSIGQDIPDLGRIGTVPFRRGAGRGPFIPGDQEPFIHGRQKDDCGKQDRNQHKQ